LGTNGFQGNIVWLVDNPMRNFPTMFLHILLWSGMLLAQAFLIGGVENMNLSLPRAGLLVAGQMILVYANAYLLFPRLYLKRRYLGYLLVGLLLILVVSYGTQELAEYYFPRGKFRPGRRFSQLTRVWFFLGRSFPLFMAFLLSSLWLVTRLFGRKENEAAQLHAEKMETELKFLRSQTNPHFLFNTLNNIYTLTLVKSDKAPEYLLTLSDMLRYMLYECNASRVSLDKEVGYIRSFIALNLLKDSGGLNVRFHSDPIKGDLTIAPMLLIPLVENAFKHSKFEDKEKGWIDIRLQLVGKELRLEVRNSLPSQQQPTDLTGGTGLTNVKRQLELVYPEQFRLEVEQMEMAFRVYLEISGLGDGENALPNR